MVTMLEKSDKRLYAPRLGRHTAQVPASEAVRDCAGACELRLDRRAHGARHSARSGSTTFQK